ncbi:MAG TPA: MBL fold metallo-hydrolase [Methanotrichaceae archaeon]|nr:MBL fold metallo-hydrolase [Methanotrichaceae archaeon]
MATIDIARQHKTNILNVGYSSTNYYLIGRNAARLMIDVGWPGTLPKLLNILKRRRVSLKDIKNLLIAHYHPDHAGLAQEIKLKGIRLVVLEDQLPFIPELCRYMKPGSPFIEIALDDNFSLKFKESREFLLNLGIEGEIIHTPGHSDDSISLILDEGIAFTGDLPGSAWAEDSRQQVELAWQRIQALNAETIYPGHGPVRHLERDESCYSCLKKGDDLSFAYLEILSGDRLAMVDIVPFTSSYMKAQRY